MAPDRVAPVQFRTAQIALWIGLRHGGTTDYSLI